MRLGPSFRIWLRRLGCRYRRPTSPIRRNPLRDLTRLDDRVAPGSIVSAVAAQSIVAVSGPLASIGLTDFELVPANSAAVGTPNSPATAWPADDGVPDIVGADSEPVHFSRTSADDNPGEGREARSLLIGAGVEVSPPNSSSTIGDDLSSDMDSGSNTIGSPRSSSDIAVPNGAGGGSPVGDASGGVRSASGVTASGGLPSQPAADTAGPQAQASGQRPRVGTQAATSPKPIAQPAITPANTTASAHAPPGHFAAQLQALLHTGDANGTFNFADISNQQSSVGSLVGGQVFGALSLGRLGTSPSGGPGTSVPTASGASHRPASLLGQALSAGADTSLGLRTSPASSGPFGLVGSQSIGDLMSHGPEGGGLLGGAETIGGAIPSANTLPHLGGTAAAAGPDPAAGLPGAVLTPVTPTKGGKGSKAAPARNDPVVTPGTFTVTFSLTEEWDNADGDPTLSEQGTIAFVGLPGGGYEDYGSNFVRAQITALANYGATNYWNLQWDGYADPAGLLYGTDFDQFNQTAFPDAPDPSTATSYTFDSAGDVPLTSTDTSTPAEHNGNTTTQHGYNNTATGDENVTVDEVGAGASRQVTVNDTATSSFHDRDTGTDDDPATASDPAYEHDSFTDTADGTSTETDQSVGTIGPDGTFQLTSFSVDLTDDYDFTDSVTGTEGQPETGGSESDGFTNGDNGHDHEQLHAAGTPDDWTASLDDTSSDAYTAGDAGGENSSQSAGGETDTNHNTFNASDGGKDNNQFHLEGQSTAATFTATNVSDTIEDVHDFTDGDGGHSGDTTSTDNNGDDYTNTDQGHADETLTVTGDQDGLSAHYGDVGTDYFTDSDSVSDGWNDAAAQDSGHDTSTDGDNGSETVTLGADASMADWQADPSQGTAPSWQITSVNGSMNGSANLNGGDDGTDTATVANSPDSDTNHYIDSATGTATFGIGLTGNGTAATLTPSVTYAVTTHAHDLNGAQWNDPEEVGNEDGSDSGTDTTDTTADDTGSVTVRQTETIDADGTVSAANPTVDLTDTGTVDETETGTDDVAAEPSGAQPVGQDGGYETTNGINDQESINDSAHLGENIQIHTQAAAGGGTSVDIDQKLTKGDISLGGGENDTNNENPDDTDTDIGSGTLSGPVTGDIHQTGTVDADGEHLGPSNGFLDPNLTGTATDTEVQTYDAPAGSGLTVPEPNLINVAQFQDSVSSGPEVGSVTGGPLLAAHVTVTTTVSVPNVHVEDDVNDIAGLWSVAKLDASGAETTTKKYVGHYHELPDYEIQEWQDETIDRTMTLTDTDDESAQGSSAAGASGEEKFIHSMSEVNDETIQTAGDSSKQHDEASLTTTDDVKSGDAGQVTEKLDESGSGSGTASEATPAGAQYPFASDSSYTQTHEYHQKGVGPPNHLVLTLVNGDDENYWSGHYKGTTADGSGEGWETISEVRTRTLGDDGQIADDDVLAPAHSWGTETDNAGNQTSYDRYGQPNDHPQEEPGFFAKVGSFISDMASAVGNGAVTAAKWVGSTAYAIADKAAQPFLMGYDLLQCGYVGIYGAITGEYFEPNWVSDLAKNAPADPNNMEAWNKYLVERELDNLKDGAIAVATLGASKAVGPVVDKVVCKVTGRGCFAAGTPTRQSLGCISVERVQEGTDLLTVEEDDPDGAFTTQQVARTFQRFAVVWELHVRGRAVRTTQEHPFYVRGKGWTPVAEIRSGDLLRTGEQDWVGCEKVVETGAAEVVYNFEVQGEHTYFIGDPVTWGFSLWAHNYPAAGGGRPPRGAKPKPAKYREHVQRNREQIRGTSQDLADKATEIQSNEVQRASKTLQRLEEKLDEEAEDALRAAREKLQGGMSDANP